MDYDFDDVWGLFTASFKTDNLRTYPTQRQLLELDAYKITAFYDQNTLQAAYSIWDFPDFLFLEYLAVQPALQGKGMGTKLINKITSTTVKPVILEVELPETTIDRHRIKFYQQLGFKLNPTYYLQPALGPNKLPMEMKIMSYPHLLSKEEFASVKNTLYQQVYNHH